jgi:hypothetical protein
VRRAAAAIRPATADPPQIGSFSRRPCGLFRFNRIGVTLHRPNSAKSSTSAQRFSFGPEPRGHMEPLELHYAGRRVLKKLPRALFSKLLGSTVFIRPRVAGTHGTPRSCPAPGDRCWSPRDTCRPRSYPEPGGENRSCGDMRCPRSCPAWPQSRPEPGGGNRSRSDMWRPRSCPASGGGCCPRSCPEPVYRWLFLVISS